MFRLLLFLKLFLSEVLVAVQKCDFLFMVLGGELSERFFLFWEEDVAEIGVPVLLSGLSEGSEHGIGPDDPFLDECV